MQVMGLWKDGAGKAAELWQEGSNHLLCASWEEGPGALKAGRAVAACWRWPGSREWRGEQAGLLAVGLGLLQGALPPHLRGV